VVKDTIPHHIHNKLQFSHEDISIFEGLKRAILRINNDFWKHQQKEKHKFQAIRAIQGYTPKFSKLVQERPSLFPKLQPCLISYPKTTSENYFPRPPVLYHHHLALVAFWA